jgi:hypothetical protein
VTSHPHIRRAKLCTFVQVDARIPVSRCPFPHVIEAKDLPITHFWMLYTYGAP